VVEGAFRLRRSCDRDVPALAALHLRTALHAYAHIFPPDAPPPDLAELTGDWGARTCGPSAAACFLAEIGAAPIGVVLAGADPAREEAGHLSRLYVDPAVWARGIGRALHDRALEELRARGFDRATLWVLEANTRARTWYERLGWSPSGARTVTYAPGAIDDVGYERPL